MFGKKSNVSYFRLLRYNFFVVNNGKDNFGKFDPRSEEEVFLSCSSKSKSLLSLSLIDSMC